MTAIHQCMTQSNKKMTNQASFVIFFRVLWRISHKPTRITSMFCIGQPWWILNCTFQISIMSSYFIFFKIRLNISYWSCLSYPFHLNENLRVIFATNSASSEFHSWLILFFHGTRKHRISYDAYLVHLKFSWWFESIVFINLSLFYTVLLKSFWTRILKWRMMKWRTNSDSPLSILQQAMTSSRLQTFSSRKWVTC